MRRRATAVFITVVMLEVIGGGTYVPAGPPAPSEPTPPDVTRILPRGRLASVDEPVFVPAANANLPDDAWILGVALDGVAHAYSLNLLNRHEVVNDRIGETPFAAVW